MQERRIFADEGPKCITEGAEGPTSMSDASADDSVIVIAEGYPSVLGAYESLHYEWKRQHPMRISLNGATNSPFDRRYLRIADYPETTRFFLALDNDEAGRAATLRIGGVLFNMFGDSAHFFVAELPRGKDPADQPFQYRGIYGFQHFMEFMNRA